MLVDLEIFGLVAALLLVGFRLVPAGWASVRQDILAGGSALAVFLYSPGGFLAALYLLVLPMLAAPVFRRDRSRFGFWAAVGLVLLPLVGLRLFTDQPFILSLGVAFATTKSLALLIAAYQGRVALRWRDAALLIFFFPLFTVGPVERLSTFAPARLQTQFSWEDICLGLSRLALGLFVVMFVCGDILLAVRDNWLGQRPEDLSALSTVGAWGLLASSFLYTYLNFVGFSEIAIGVSRLFGLKVAENFDRPLWVTNTVDFWKRYHMSMGNWVNQVLFFPIAVFIKRQWAPYAATMIAFVLFGLWHDFTLRYVLWGLGNGAGVALVQWAHRQGYLPLARGKPALRLVVGPLGCILTLSWIGFLQTMANLPSLAAADLFTRRLLGL
jgi:D-alanyl-lipoteichoic acid acyltransferase DltB (MBOAT superfamily)